MRPRLLPRMKSLALLFKPIAPVQVSLRWVKKNLSPSLSFLNCFAMMQAKRGPTCSLEWGPNPTIWSVPVHQRVRFQPDHQWTRQSERSHSCRWWATFSRWQSWSQAVVHRWSWWGRPGHTLFEELHILGSRGPAPSGCFSIPGLQEFCGLMCPHERWWRACSWENCKLEGCLLASFGRLLLSSHTATFRASRPAPYPEEEQKAQHQLHAHLHPAWKKHLSIKATHIL